MMNATICLVIYLVSLVGVIMWRIWFNRNQVVHGMGKQDMAAVVDWSDFRAANVAENKDGMSGKIRNVVVRWQSPTEGLYKVNTDASVDSGKHLAGLGFVIRDHLGFVMASSAQCTGACFTPIIAEAMAVLRDLELAVETGLLPVVAETDALGVVNLVNAGSPIAADIGLVVKDIITMFVSRKANYVAHSLAKMALGILENSSRMEENPPCV